MRCRRATVTVRPVVRAAVMVIGLAVSLAVLPHAEGQGTTDAFVWVRQFGTPSDDSGSAVAVDATGVYVAGRMLGSFPGDAYDAYLRKYDLDGTVLWTRPIATDSFDYANAVAADGSGVSIAGHTGGSLQWGASGGGVDAYVQKYEVNGTLLFTGQFGSPDFDTALAVAGDGTGTYVAGRTEGTILGQTSLGSVDAFVRRYNVDGNVSNVSWTQQFGTSGYDYASGLAVDATGVYVAGTTSPACTSPAWWAGRFPVRRAPEAPTRSSESTIRTATRCGPANTVLPAAMPDPAWGSVDPGCTSPAKRMARFLGRRVPASRMHSCCGMTSTARFWGSASSARPGSTKGTASRLVCPESTSPARRVEPSRERRTRAASTPFWSPSRNRRRLRFHPGFCTMRSCSSPSLQASESWSRRSR
ncbi:MAG: hypothetical protein E6K08_08250 [Methanobacteriota archaeon]|nr:MAG: hypothetical protein E6K08_08250 [Euryarchaeota archaeon]